VEKARCVAAPGRRVEKAWADSGIQQEIQGITIKSHRDNSRYEHEKKAQGMGKEDNYLPKRSSKRRSWDPQVARSSKSPSAPSEATQYCLCVLARLQVPEGWSF
jgi:hypothetical protein